MAFVLVVLLSLQSAPTYAINNLGTKICSAIAAGGILLWAYKLSPIVYQTIRSKIQLKLEAEIAEDIILLNTSNKTINIFPLHEREKKFKKKAWLQERKKRIINKLEEIRKTKKELSDEHNKSIKNMLAKLNLILEFNVLDSMPLISQNNPFEDYYKKSNIIDEMIENKIVSSCIFYAKPESELSLKEKDQKLLSKLSVNNILLNMIGCMKGVARIKLMNFYNKMQNNSAL